MKYGQFSICVLASNAFNTFWLTDISECQVNTFKTKIAGKNWKARHFDTSYAIHGKIIGKKSNSEENKKSHLKPQILQAPLEY